MVAATWEFSFQIIQRAYLLDPKILENLFDDLMNSGEISSDKLRKVRLL